MNKKNLNIASVCIISIIIVFALTQKDRFDKKNNSNNISIGENGSIQTKADEYRSNILNTVSEENINNFKKFTKDFEKNSDDNLTDILSKDVFTQYIKFNTSGELKEEEILAVTENILKEKVGVSNPASYNDIKITSSNTASLKTYGNNMAILDNAINKGLLSINKKTNKTPYIASIYMKASEILTDMTVPESLGTNHLQMINGFKKYSEGLTMVDQQNNDPAKALLGLNNIKEATDEVMGSFEKIKKTIILNKVSYTEIEPGFRWISDDANNTSIKLE